MSGINIRHFQVEAVEHFICFLNVFNNIVEVKAKIVNSFIKARKNSIKKHSLLIKKIAAHLHKVSDLRMLRTKCLIFGSSSLKPAKSVTSLND